MSVEWVGPYEGDFGVNVEKLQKCSMQKGVLRKVCMIVNHRMSASQMMISAYASSAYPKP